MQVLKVGVPDAEYKPITPEGDAPRFLSFLPVMGLPRVVVYGKTGSQPVLPTSDVVLFMFSPWEGTALQAVRFFSEAIVSAYVVADFMCPGGGR